MALHISRVEITNFRNFEYLLIDPFPATAVIVGENNVGKTNLLYALRILLDPDLPDSARSLREEDLFDPGGGPCVGEPVKISIEMAGFDGDEKAQAILVDCLTSVEPSVARIEYVFEPLHEMEDAEGDEADRSPDPPDDSEVSVEDYDWRIVGGPPEEGRLVRFEPRRYIGLRVLPALRDATDELTRRRSPLRELLDRVKPDAQTLEAAASDVTAAMEDLLTDPAVDDLQTSIKMQTVEMVGPVLPVDPTLGIAPAVPKQLLRQIRLFTDGGRKRGMLDTSLGTANVLYLSLLLEAVARRRAASEHMTIILGVEEPEAHLHVQIQRRLFGFLLRAEPSLILTSHSPHIAAVTPLPSVVLLRQTESGSVATTAHGASLSKQEVSDLERYIDATRAELLFAKIVVLVEGEAEEHVIPALARAYGFDLNDYGVSVVSVQGTDFAPYRKLLGPSGLSIPHVTITDGDRDIEHLPATSAGLSRGVRLLRDRQVAADIRTRCGFPERPLKEGHRKMDPDAYAELSAILESDLIFVGDTTLETDLAAVFPQSFKLAAADLYTASSAARIAGIVDDIVGVDVADSRDELVRRIEQKGKGRFAQRLAGYLAKESPILDYSANDEDGHKLSAVRALDYVSKYCRGKSLGDFLSERGNEAEAG